MKKQLRCRHCKKDLINGGVGKKGRYYCWDCAAVPTLEDIEHTYGLDFGPRVRAALLNLRDDEGHPVFRGED